MLLVRLLGRARRSVEVGWVSRHSCERRKRERHQEVLRIASYAVKSGIPIGGGGTAKVEGEGASHGAPLAIVDIHAARATAASSY